LRAVHFAFDSADLDPVAQQTLENNLLWLRQNPGVQVQIEGHTDERGTVEYNLLLGERRAKTVKAYLVARGIPESVLHTISYGEERPLETGPNEESFAVNRRAQVLVY
jgi:peptidoglycan-associated lipoprotein